MTRDERLHQERMQHSRAASGADLGCVYGLLALACCYFLIALIYALALRIAEVLRG